MKIKKRFAFFLSHTFPPLLHNRGKKTKRLFLWILFLQLWQNAFGEKCVLWLWQSWLVVVTFIITPDLTFHKLRFLLFFLGGIDNLNFEEGASLKKLSSFHQKFSFNKFKTKIIQAELALGIDRSSSRSTKLRVERSSKIELQGRSLRRRRAA